MLCQMLLSRRASRYFALMLLLPYAARYERRYELHAVRCLADVFAASDATRHTQHTPLAATRKILLRAIRCRFSLMPIRHYAVDGVAA